LAQFGVIQRLVAFSPRISEKGFSFQLTRTSFYDTISVLTYSGPYASALNCLLGPRPQDLASFIPPLSSNFFRHRYYCQNMEQKDQQAIFTTNSTSTTEPSSLLFYLLANPEDANNPPATWDSLKHFEILLSPFPTYFHLPHDRPAPRACPRVLLAAVIASTASPFGTPNVQSRRRCRSYQPTTFSGSHPITVRAFQISSQVPFNLKGRKGVECRLPRECRYNVFGHTSSATLDAQLWHWERGYGMGLDAPPGVSAGGKRDLQLYSAAGVISVAMSSSQEVSWKGGKRPPPPPSGKKASI